MSNCRSNKFEKYFQDPPTVNIFQVRGPSKYTWVDWTLVLSSSEPYKSHLLAVIHCVKHSWKTFANLVFFFSADFSITSFKHRYNTVEKLQKCILTQISRFISLCIINEWLESFHPIWEDFKGREATVDELWGWAKDRDKINKAYIVAWWKNENI